MQAAATIRLAVAAIVAVVAAVLVIALLVRGEPYRVSAEFVTASQLVEGNLVKVGGEEVGKVETIELTDDGRARIGMTIDGDYAPLREGTRAIVRIASLSGVANRYVDLHLGGADRAEIPDGGRIAAENSQAAVDIDQLFNVFDDETRKGVRKTIELFSEFNAGRADEAQAALRYLNPMLAAQSALFAELDADRTELERFLVQNARLVTDVADRREDLAGLISNLRTTMSAVSDERDSLGEAIGTLPDFMRRANTTFVNLRAALDDLRPLVEDSKPIVRDKLRPLFAELRPFAADAQPTFRDLVRTITRPGSANDLIDLLLLQPKVDRVANEKAVRNGKAREGAFPATIAAMPPAVVQTATLRPYMPDLMGWFDDFSHSGAYDALGGFSRSGLQLNAFTFNPLVNALAPVPPNLRDELFAASVTTGVVNRCPGSVERPAPDGSNPWAPDHIHCDVSKSYPNDSAPGRRR